MTTPKMLAEMYKENLDRFLEGSKAKEPVFHAAKADVSEFSPKHRTELSSMGHHFGTADQANFRMGQYDFKAEHPNVGKYHLAIKNPLEVSHMASFAPDHLAEQMMDMGILDPKKYDAMSEKHGYDAIPLGAELVKILKKHGYDSLMYPNEREGEGHSYVPFNPTQIKSATGNTGAFDPTNPDITKADGGSIYDSFRAKLDEMKARNAHNNPIIEQYHRETRHLPHEEQPTLDSWLEENGLQLKAGGGAVKMAIGGGMKRNWPKGEVEQFLRPLRQQTDTGRDPQEELDYLTRLYDPNFMAELDEGDRNLINRSFADLQKNVAMNQWINANLANYMKKQMAGPDDPVRKLAEQGISHLDQWKANQLFGSPENELANEWRRDYLQGGEQLGKSDLAKQWENASDQSLYPKEVRELLAYGKGEPWMENLNHKDLLMATHSSAAPKYLGFDLITDHLKNLLDAGKIRPDQLNKVTMEQVIKQMHQEREAKERKEREESLKNTEGMPVHSTYPNGWRWQELNLPEEVPEEEQEPRLRKAIKSEGEMMGHCLQKEEMEWPEKVMNGDSRLFSLRDEKNEPHVTIEMHPALHPLQAYHALPEKEQKKLDQEVIDQHFGGERPHKNLMYTNEGLELLSKHYLNKYGQPRPSIAQIYGKQDQAPIGEYIPYVQDFVHSVNPSDIKRQAAQNAQLNDMNENYNAKLKEWLDKKGIQYPRYMTDKERWGHEENRMSEAMGTADQNPFAKGGTAKPLHFARNTDEMRLAIKKAK
jgi:hypothetical protein